MDSGAAQSDFRGWLCLARGMPASTGHCSSNPTKSQVETTWTKAFVFLAEKTRFPSSSGGRPWGHQSAEAMSMVRGAVGNG